MERTQYKNIRIGDIISGDKLYEFSGENIESTSNESFILNQVNIHPKFTDWNREDLGFYNYPPQKEEDDRIIENMKKDFNNTPPLPPDGDGLHRIITAKELGHKTILQWKLIVTLPCKKCGGKADVSLYSDGIYVCGCIGKYCKSVPFCGTDSAEDAIKEWDSWCLSNDE